jgi:hypothetical protein
MVEPFAAAIEGAIKIGWAGMRYLPDFAAVSRTNNRLAFARTAKNPIHQRLAFSILGMTSVRLHFAFQ